MSTLSQKLNICFNSMILFYFINSPETYMMTSNLINKTLISMNCPTDLGFIIHTLLFFTITYLSMGSSNIKNKIKIKHSLYGTLIYYFVSSQQFYSFMNILLNNNNYNCPTTIGLILQSIVYFSFLLAVMYLP